MTKLSERQEKLMYSLIFGLSVFVLVAIGIFIVKSMEIIGYGLIVVLIGVFNADLSHGEKEFLNVVILNELIIVVLMVVTRIAYYLATFEAWVGNPLNILTAFIVYSALCNVSSIFVWYILKGK